MAANLKNGTILKKNVKPYLKQNLKLNVIVLRHHLLSKFLIEYYFFDFFQNGRRRRDVSNFIFVQAVRQKYKVDFNKTLRQDTPPFLRKMAL